MAASNALVCFFGVVTSKDSNGCFGGAGGVKVVAPIGLVAEEVMAARNLPLRVWRGLGYQAESEIVAREASRQARTIVLVH